MSPTKMTPSPKINPNHFPPLGYEEEKRASPESPSQQIQHKQKQEVEKKVKKHIFWFELNNNTTIGEDKEIVKDNWLAMRNGSSFFVLA